MNYVDHGDTNYRGIPSVKRHNIDLRGALWKVALNTSIQFAHRVIYVEVCKSASMFDGLLPDNWNIYAVTSAGPNESTEAWYPDQQRSIEFGSLVSVMWMYDTEQADLCKHTLQQQYKTS
jgi:legumain